MKGAFVGIKVLATAAVLIVLLLIAFSSCGGAQNDAEQSSSLTSRRTETDPQSASGTSSASGSQSESKPESTGGTSSGSGSQTESTPEYIDTTFSADTFIKYCNASEEPFFESVFKFDKNGTATYSYNMFEGFVQSTERYFIRKYRSGIYQIMVYEDSADAAEALFTVYNNKDISADASASFISEKEFNEIYAFHSEWNKQAAEHDGE